MNTLPMAGSGRLFWGASRREGPLSMIARRNSSHQPKRDPVWGIGNGKMCRATYPSFCIAPSFLLVYIANGHSQESMQRKILSTRQEVEDLKAEYILLQSEVMHLGRRTEVLDRLQNMGMGWKSPQEPPVELEYKNEGTSPKRKGT